MTDTPIRDAATLILVRDARDRPAVLMGQRGAGAAFMPMKFVFPGGAVDPGDAAVPLALPLPPDCHARLAAASAGPAPEALAAAAIRELWEEAGLVLGQRGAWPGTPPPDWEDFAATGHLPSASALSFIFRAITPPGRPRRFDARFFLADAGQISGDPDDFSAASDELAHLQWVPLEEAQSFDLPFITEVVLAEVAARLRGTAAEGVPFFKNDSARSEFLRL
ncbi:MAG: NUDIX hydrolase [Paracoccaceae bacterium]|nr:NUDIX hydrolase [Paracoccaceae bacterium]